MAIKQPAKFDLAESMIRDLEKEISDSLLHNPLTTTASDEPATSFSMADMDRAIRKAKEICDRQPRMIIVVPQEMMGFPQELYDQVFGKGSLVISEGEYARLEDECRKSFSDMRLNREEPLVASALSGFHGLPVRFIRGKPMPVECDHE